MRLIMTPDTNASANGPAKLKPSRKWYLLALVLLVVGVLVFVIAVSVAYDQLYTNIAGLQRVVVPGKKTVEIEEPGQYTVYYEKRSQVGEETYEGPTPLPEISLKVTGPKGESVEVQRKENADMYRLDEYAGTGTWIFQANRPGSYRLIVPPPENAPKTRLVLAVGDINLSQTMNRVFGLFGAAGLLAIMLVAAGVIALLTFTSRLRNKARLAELEQQ
jgi:hypothetical protein